MRKFFSFSYVQSLNRPDSKDSIKSFAMFMSVVLGFLLGIMLGVSLLIDASYDGKIDSDLYGCSTYVAAIGVLVTLSGIPKIAVDRKKIECEGQNSQASGATEINEDINTNQNEQ